ncbi:hypothetical protein MMPV_007616 [Pyropia vietnamensis]
MLRSLSSPLFGAMMGDSPRRLPSGGSSGVSSGVESGVDSGSEAGSGKGRSDGGGEGGSVRRSPFSSSLSLDGEDDYVFLGDEILLTFDRLEMIADLKDIVSKERARLAATIRDRTTGLSATRHRLRKETAQLASRLLPDEASRARLQARLAARRAELLASLREPAVVSFGEKVAFMLGLTLLLVTEGVLLLSPTRMWVWYAGLIGPLLAARAVLYRASKAGFFLYDFCYAAQLLLLVHLFLFPASGPLFRVNFAVANGPLAWAVVLWRNSLVFHSLDRLTSLAVHFLPPLVTFCLRWYGDGRVGGADAGEGWHYGAAGDGEWRDHAMYAVGLPLGIYAAWQAAYLVKTEVISRNKLERDPELMTSLRWLTRHPGSLFYRAINAFGPTHHVATFVLLQGIYTLLTLSASVVWYESKAAHAVFLAGLFAVAAFNGASFYFEVVRPPPGGAEKDGTGRGGKGKGKHRSRSIKGNATGGGGGGGRKLHSHHHTSD